MKRKCTVTFETRNVTSHKDKVFMIYTIYVFCLFYPFLKNHAAMCIGRNLIGLPNCDTTGARRVPSPSRCGLRSVGLTITRVSTITSSFRCQRSGHWKGKHSGQMRGLISTAFRYEARPNSNLFHSHFRSPSSTQPCTMASNTWAIVIVPWLILAE